VNLNFSIDERSQAPHRLAVVLVCATFPLIWVGGLVTTYDAGMAVPDWPETYGYNLFLYPLSTWLGGPWDLFIEHGHRLLGSLVGLLTIGLVVITWYCDDRSWVRWLSVGCLALVLAQGVLGGARVLFDELTLARVHGCVGPLFLVVCVATAVVTSRYWDRGPRVEIERARQFKRLALITTIVAFLQLVIGAYLRHLPAHWSFNVVKVLVGAHLIVAAILLAHVLWMAYQCSRNTKLWATYLIRRPALILVGLMLVQLTLGVATWVVKYAWPTWLPQWSAFNSYTIEAESMLQASIVTAHVAVGSLILAVAMVLSLRSMRLMSFSKEAVVATSCSLGMAELVT